MKVKCSPFLVQIEQLQAVTMERSVVHSNLTWPQWQPPVKVLLSGIASSSPNAGHETIAHPRDIVSIAGEAGGQFALLEAGADRKQQEEDRCEHEPPQRAEQ